MRKWPPQPKTTSRSHVFLHQHLYLPLILAAACRLAVFTRANSLCDKSYFWHPDGTREDSDSDWSSTFFEKGPCLQVSGVGATQTYKKTVLIIDRTDSVNTYMKLPGSNRLAFAEEVDFNSGEWSQRGLNVLTNTFCSSGQHVSSGRFLSIGGAFSAGIGGGYKKRGMFVPKWEEYSSSYRENLTNLGIVRRRREGRELIEDGGTFSVRQFKPCSNGDCDFEFLAKTKDPRWYPTTQLLGDGRLLIVGGAKKATNINSKSVNMPTIEYFPRRSGEGSFEVSFLDYTLPFNLYPIVHLLPSSLVFIFAGKSYTLWDTKKNRVKEGRYPRLNTRMTGGETQYLYPLAATSAMFPLSPTDDYFPHIMICGGAPAGAYLSLRFKSDGRCWRIKPLEPAPRWRQESMKRSRVMPLSVLLPDGNLLIHGGASYGYGSLEPRTSKNPVLEPEMFNTKTKEWFNGDLGVSKIARLYHSCGFLLHDGRVFFSGSNPNRGGFKHWVDEDNFPTEFRTELYSPPYRRSRDRVPDLKSAPEEVGYGDSFNVKFSAKRGAKSIEVILAQPGFSTHNQNHGMRNVILEIEKLRSNGGDYSVEVRVPENKDVLPPTWYWLFVVVDGVPNRDGHYVMVD